MPKGNVVTRNICSGGRWDEIEGSARPLVYLARNLLDDDPGFIDATKEDFRLREDSPAFELGFEEIPIEEEEIGLITPRPGRPS